MVFVHQATRARVPVVKAGQWASSTSQASPACVHASQREPLPALVLAGLSSVWTSVVCRRELSSERQLMRIDNLLGLLKSRAQALERGQ
jgi:hypothetical protein